jgi:hypothetical protein
MCVFECWDVLICYSACKSHLPWIWIFIYFFVIYTTCRHVWDGIQMCSEFCLYQSMNYIITQILTIIEPQQMHSGSRISRCTAKHIVKISVKTRNLSQIRSYYSTETYKMKVYKDSHWKIKSVKRKVSKRLASKLGMEKKRESIGGSRWGALTLFLHPEFLTLWVLRFMLLRYELYAVTLYTIHYNALYSSGMHIWIRKQYWVLC